MIWMEATIVHVWERFGEDPSGEEVMENVEI